MTQTNAVTIPRHLYTGLWVAIVILVLIVIVVLLTPATGAKTSGLDDAITSAEAPIIVVIGASLEPRFFSADNPDDRNLRELVQCGTLGVGGKDRTKLPRECGDFKGPINRYSNITFLEFGNGSCTAGVDSLGRVYTKHTSGSLMNKKPCHTPHPN